MNMSEIERNIRKAGAGEHACTAEQECLISLMLLFAKLDPPPDPIGLFPRYGELKERFLEAAGSGDCEAVEETFLTLYCHVHGHEAPYTSNERLRIEETGGYWCHAGGISPIIKAGPYINAETVSADFGAGNGLQGLLMQKLHPHEKTVQIEISSSMIEAGKGLQAWIGIPDSRVEWRACDVCGITPSGMDFIYLYRPVRPEGRGRLFYERFAAALDSEDRDVVIFSIADCLGDFLSRRFVPFYSDGHLTCYCNRGSQPLKEI